MEGYPCGKKPERKINQCQQEMSPKVEDDEKV
jgi:hypothetical protein